MSVALSGVRTRRTAILLGMLAIAAIVAVSCIAALAARERIAREAEKSLASLAATMSAHVNKAMASADAVLDAVEKDLVGVKMNDAAVFKRRVRREDVSRMLRDKWRDVEKAGAVTLVSPTGELLSTSRTFPTPVRNLTSAEEVTAFAQDPKLIGFVGHRRGTATRTNRCSRLRVASTIPPAGSWEFCVSEFLRMNCSHCRQKPWPVWVPAPHCRCIEPMPP